MGTVYQGQIALTGEIDVPSKDAYFGIAATYWVKLVYDTPIRSESVSGTIYYSLRWSTSKLQGNGAVPSSGSDANTPNEAFYGWSTTSPGTFTSDFYSIESKLGPIPNGPNDWMLLVSGDNSGVGVTYVPTLNANTITATINLIFGDEWAVSYPAITGIFTLRPANPKLDFDGDGKSDILLRNTSTGQEYIWLMSGASIGSGSGSIGTNPGTGWQVVGAGDYNGDGEADILLQNTSTGQEYMWLMSGTTIAAGSGALGVNPGTAWQVVGNGDFDGDGKSDILMQNSTTGQAYLWLMSGTTIGAGSGAIGTNAGTTWKVAGVGDFNGDGKSDILLRNSTTGEDYIWCMSGTTIGAGSGSIAVNPGTAWQVVGTGDFDGDGKCDILLQNATTGQLYEWLMSGTTIGAGSGAIGTNPGTAWKVAGTGDYNGDGTADIVLQNATTGQAYVWLMSGTSILSGSGAIGVNAGTAWQFVAGTGS